MPFGKYYVTRFSNFTSNGQLCRHLCLHSCARLLARQKTRTDGLDIRFFSLKWKVGHAACAASRKLSPCIPGKLYPQHCPNSLLCSALIAIAEVSSAIHISTSALLEHNRSMFFVRVHSLKPWVGFDLDNEAILDKPRELDELDVEAVDGERRSIGEPSICTCGRSSTPSKSQKRIGKETHLPDSS